jgi:hypothetical protein
LVASHKNASEFSLNIYEVKSDYQGFMKYISNSWQKENFVNLKKTLVRKESYNLPTIKDYKMHKTSVELKPLPSGIYVGEYLVEGKVQGNFYFIASQSRIIYQNKNDNQSVKNELKLVNRDNGKILPKEDLEFYEFVNGKISPKISLTTNDTAVFKISESLNKEYYRSIFGSSAKNQ